MRPLGHEFDLLVRLFPAAVYQQECLSIVLVNIRFFLTYISLRHFHIYCSFAFHLILFELPVCMLSLLLKITVYFFLPFHKTFYVMAMLILSYEYLPASPPSFPYILTLYLAGFCFISEHILIFLCINIYWSYLYIHSDFDYMHRKNFYTQIFIQRLTLYFLLLPL